jgi:hypothetical protein
VSLSFVLSLIVQSRLLAQDTAIYQVLGNVTQIAERCVSSGASCGSHFLDINFRAYLEDWHRTRDIRLSEENLARYMHAFTYSQKLGFNGQDGNDLYFECYDGSDYRKSDHVIGLAWPSIEVLSRQTTLIFPMTSFSTVNSWCR